MIKYYHSGSQSMALRNRFRRLQIFEICIPWVSASNGIHSNSISPSSPTSDLLKLLKWKTKSNYSWISRQVSNNDPIHCLFPAAGIRKTMVRKMSAPARGTSGAENERRFFCPIWCFIYMEMSSGQSGLKRLNLYLDLKLITTQLRWTLTAYFAMLKPDLCSLILFISIENL